MRRPVLVFDFGNVLAYFDYRHACERFGRYLGISGEELLGRVRALGFTQLVQEYERGQIRAETFSQRLCARVGLVIPHEEFATAWSDIFRLNEPVARLVEFLKGRGYTLVLGSNTNDLHSEYFQRQFASSLTHFDYLVLSHEIGHLKPSAAFYTACTEVAAASPSDCVFIDDLEENVAGARSVGLQGLVFRDIATLLDDLRGLGVEVPDRLNDLA